MKWDAAFHSCLSSEGVDLGPLLDGSVGLSEADETAMDECREKTAIDRGPRPVSAAEEKKDAAYREGAMRTADCLRAKGHEIDDPDADGSVEFPSDLSDTDFEACHSGCTRTSAAAEQKHATLPLTAQVFGRSLDAIFSPDLT